MNTELGKLYNTVDECQKVVDEYNRSQGGLKYIDCKHCCNRGNTAEVEQEDWKISVRLVKCNHCSISRQNAEKLAKNGYWEMFLTETFRNYIVSSKWQESVYNKAKDFVTKRDSQCFVIGGQVGSGKTHICTSICNHFLFKYNVEVCVWGEVVNELKRNVMTNPEEFDKLMNYLKNVDVLFIDDFFRGQPTTADIDKAFQIINYRYIRHKSNQAYVTIISSEKTISELAKVDEAIASRLVEMSNYKYAISINKDITKNYRLNQI